MDECPSFSDFDLWLLSRVEFWVEGVFLTTCAILGIIGNVVACLIITGKEMKNSFNLLLVCLAAFDSTYLLGAILKAFQVVLLLSRPG